MTTPTPDRPAEQTRVRVVPLEWQDREGSRAVAMARTPIGNYYISLTPDGYAVDFGEDEIAHIGHDSPGDGDARQRAMLHAQTRHEEVVLACLSPTPAEASEPTPASGEAELGEADGNTIPDDDWLVWWQGSGPLRGDHVMRTGPHYSGYAGEVAYLGDQHHKAVGELVAEHNKRVHKLNRALKAARNGEREANERAEIAEAAHPSADLARLREERDAAIKEAAHWKANHDEMVAQNAVLRDRPDLPADRLPALARLREENERLRKALEPFDREAGEWEGYGDKDKLVEPFGSYGGNLNVGHLRSARAARTEGGE